MRLVLPLRTKNKEFSSSKRSAFVFLRLENLEGSKKSKQKKTHTTIMTEKLKFNSIFMAGLKAGAVSIALNAILFYVFHAVGVLTDDIMIQDGQALTIVPILMSSLVPSLIGASVFFLFEKFSNNGWRNFRILALVLFVLTLANPFMGIPGVTMGYALVLDLMHVVVAGSLMYFLSLLQTK